MTDNNSSSKKLEALNSEIFDLQSIPSVEEARTENLASGIDTSELKKWALEQHKKAQAKTILAKAREKRSEQESIINRVVSQTTQTFDELREWCTNKVSQLSPSDRAQVYCRNFEEASEQDLLELKQDILALEKMSEKQQNDDSDQN